MPAHPDDASTLRQSIVAHYDVAEEGAVVDEQIDFIYISMRR